MDLTPTFDKESKKAGTTGSGFFLYFYSLLLIVYNLLDGYLLTSLVPENVFSIF